jgi:hypothetical protein
MSLLANGGCKYSLKQYRLSEIRQKVEELALSIRCSRVSAQHDLITSPQSFDSTLCPSSNVSILKNMSLFASSAGSDLCYCKQCKKDAMREITENESFENDFRIRTPPVQYSKEIYPEYSELSSRSKYLHASPRFSEANLQSFEMCYRLNEFLAQLELEEFSNLFRENRINYDDLKLLSKEDLAELKIPVGPRNRILHALGKITSTDIKNEIETVLQPIHTNRDSITSSQPDSISLTSNSRRTVSPSPVQETSRGKLKGEVESFIWELQSMYKRRRKESREASKSLDMDHSTTIDASTGRSSKYSTVASMLKDVCSHQEEMMRVIQFNHKEIQSLRKNSPVPTSKPTTPKLVRNISVSRKRSRIPVSK